MTLAAVDVFIQLKDLKKEDSPILIFYLIYLVCSSKKLGE